MILIQNFTPTCAITDTYMYILIYALHVHIYEYVYLCIYKRMHTDGYGTLLIMALGFSYDRENACSLGVISP